jgi:hypothetical protein
MANALYDKGRQGFLDGSIDWDTDDIRIILLDEDDDAPNLATDDNLDDVVAGARVAVSSSLAGKTVTDGVADANDVVLTAVSGDQFESITGYKHTGTESTSRLIFNHDTGTGFPTTPNGADITVQWDSGANKIFKL